MNKKRILHVMVLAVLVTFAVFGLAGCTITTMSSDGYTEDVLQIRQIDKDFAVVDMLFVTTTVTKGSTSGRIIDGSPLTFEMLMRAAKEKGADDIVNLRIDTIIKKGGGINPVAIGGKVYKPSELVITTYTASFLAIKYK